MLTEVMLDIETLSTESNSVIVALAAVPFDIGNKFVYETGAFYTAIDIQSCLDAGLTCSGRTLRWWLTQPDLDRARAMFSEPTMHLSMALHMFSQLFERLRSTQGNNTRPINVWGNGADFDIPIVRNAYRAVGMAVPFENFTARCYRTIKMLRPDIKLQRRGIAHTAHSDVISQAYHMIEVMHAD